MRKFAYILVRLVHRYFSDGIGRQAAELAYFLLFSIFPMLMVLHAALSFINISQESLQIGLEILPQAVRDIIFGYLDHLQTPPRMGAFWTGIALTLYFLSRAVRSLSMSMNQIYRTKENRPLWLRTGVSLLMTVATILLLIGSIIMIFSSERLFGWLFNLSPNGIEILRLCDRLLSGMVAIFYVLLCYRLLPAEKVKWSQAVGGAVGTIVVWLGMTVGLSFYIDHLANYDVVYGSIGALIILMLWLYLTGATLLMGGVLNHILSKELPTERHKLGFASWVHEDAI